jgi:hypothetical protein
MDININDIIIEKSDEVGTALGHVIDITPNWVTIHWLMGTSTHMPGGQWACPKNEAQSALESGEWQILSEEDRLI